VFIDANKNDVVEGRQLGVEPICSLLQVAPSTYYAAKDRAPSARAVSDAALARKLVTLSEANYAVYGVRKLWKAARRAGHDIGRDQTGRLMRAAGIEGATRSKRVKTTRPDPLSARHPDLVKREFTATAPNRLWVTDLTFAPTWAGVADVCFIIDAHSRMIVGWRCAQHMRTEMVLDAIEMARWGRGAHHDDLRCHSDAGSQFTSIRYGEPTRPNSSAGPPAQAPGRQSKISSLRPSAGCTGTTRRASTVTSATFRRPSSSRRSMLTKPPAISWWESTSASLQQTQSGSISKQIDEIVEHIIAQEEPTAVHALSFVN
jgi:hypothetical protein